MTSATKIAPNRQAAYVRLLAFAAICAAIAGPAGAAESGAGVYPLGLRASLSGILPEPGLYLQNDVYHYGGNTEASRSFPIGGRIVADARNDMWIDLMTLMWSTPLAVAGGNFAVSATVPIGGPSIDAGVAYTSASSSTYERDIHRSTTTVGDPFVVASVGWHAGNLHWMTGVGVNIPVGDYHEHHIANLAFHYWAADPYASVTWLDPKTGREFSASVGVTFNGTNPVTQYKNGDELHLDFAAVQHLPHGWSVGMVGYHYNQLTGDSGTGAVLGKFEGRVTALGGLVGYKFKIDQRDILASLKVYREFDVANRLEGTAAYFTLSLPLTNATRTAGAKPITTK